MKIEVEDYLRLVENNNSICFWDIEATGLRGDYNSIIIASIKPYHGKVMSFKVGQPGNDKKVVREVADCLDQFDCWVTYYGKGFDVPMLRTRALKWGQKHFPAKHHIDLYYTLKYNLLTARRSQAHLLEWLETPEEKMTVGAEMWNKILYDFDSSMKIMQQRCESDAENTQALYEQTKHLIKDIKK